MGLKILHSADWHLDSPFGGFSPEQRDFLRRELNRIPGKIAAVCCREKCDLVLLAGDIFDGPYTKESFRVAAEALEEMGVPVFVSPGNHDCLSGNSPWIQEIWPENVHIFGTNMEYVDLPELDCRVFGAGYAAMDCPGLLEGFRASGNAHWCVGVLHGDGVNYQSPYCPVTGRQVRESGLDYLALGHVHSHGAFRSGSAVCGWPGCPMGRGWDETGTKGVYLVELEERASLRFLPVEGPRFREMTLDSGEDGIAALEEKLPLGGNRDFYRITLTGSGGGDVRDLQEKFPNLILKDHRQKHALWDRAGGDSLEGLYFQLLRQRLPEDPDTVRLAAEISRKLLDGEEVALP